MLSENGGISMPRPPAVTLTEKEHRTLESFVHRGKANARTLTRARILLKSAEGWSTAELGFVTNISPGQPERVDYEYERRGTRNLFVVVEPLAGWRHVDVTKQRTSAATMLGLCGFLVDEVYPVKAPASGDHEPPPPLEETDS